MPTTTSISLLESIPYLASLSPKIRDRLLASVTKRSFSKGELIILEGEPCPGVFVIESGMVKLYRTSMRGDEQIVRIVYPKDYFECTPIFDHRPNPMSAQAIEATKAYLLPAPDFWAALSTQPKALLEMLAIISLRLRSLLNTVDDFSFKRVPSRLANLLLQLSGWQNDAPEDIWNEMGIPNVASPSLTNLTQQDLACMLGCSRQTVNNALQELRRDNIIEMDGHRIVVLKPKELKQL